MIFNQLPFLTLSDIVPPKFCYSAQHGDSRDEAVIAEENEHSDQVQILDKAVSISHSTDSLRKGMHPTVFLLAIDE